ncbi:MAG: AAA family ATPase [Actinobacteria bacterium]|nr:AAA family ATPase [Actinomycetota bacterium]
MSPGAPQGVATELDPETGPEAEPLLEREQELAELTALAGQSRRGNGRLVLVEAHAGLGKTRLLQAARRIGAEQGMHVLRARATELERDFPFALVRQLFAPGLVAMAAKERDALLEGASAAARGALGLAAGNGDASGPGDEYAVLYGLYWLTAALAERHPLLLSIDDAHWADAASLRYLSFLLPRLEDLPALVVVTCRPGEPDVHAELAQIGADAAARRLAPAALSRAAAAALLAGELGAAPDDAFASACHEATGGNPFLLQELAITLAAQAVRPVAAAAGLVPELAPEGVTRTVLTRVARLTPQARALARAIAVLGDDSDHRLVAALAKLDEDATLAAADELRAVAILDAGTSLRFVHPLVRNALATELPASARAAAHARAANLLRERGASPEQIATHLLATTESGSRATAETLLEAARRALADGAARSAVAYLTRALREPPPADRRAALLEALITAVARAGDFATAVAAEPDVLAETDRDPALLVRMAPELMLWLLLGGRYDDATALLERAVEEATRRDDVDGAMRLEAHLLTTLQLPPAAGRPRLARYRARLAPESAGGRLAAAFEALWAMTDGSASSAVAFARQALDGGRVFFEQPDLLPPSHAVLALAFADELDAAQHAVEQAIEAARRSGATLYHAGALYMRAGVARIRGDLAAAEADVRQALGAARLVGPIAVPPLMTALLVNVLTERGELEAAEAELEAVGMSGAVPDGGWFATLLFDRGRLRLARGATQDGAADLLELRERLERTGAAGNPMTPASSYAALALSALGEQRRARELAEEQLVHAERWGAPTAVASAQRSLGLTRGGAAGLELLEAAARTLERSPARLDRAHALCDLGAALRRANRRGQAREPLAEALELARACGAVPLAKRAYDELRTCGARVRRWTPIGVDSLSPSERRVAELAASGRTNREIAQALFLTVKTIESHLAAAYDKLGISSRRQLPEALGGRAG